MEEIIKNVLDQLYACEVSGRSALTFGCAVKTLENLRDMLEEMNGGGQDGEAEAEHRDGD